MKFLSRLDDFEHIVIDGSVSGTGLSSLYLKDTATPILRIGNNTGDSFITYDGSELSISSDVDLRLTTPTDQDVFLITSSGNIVTTQAGGTFTIGGGLTLEAITGGFLKADANGVVSVDNSSYLTNETDTLDSVTGRGNTTTNAITTGGLTSNGSVYVTNSIIRVSGNSSSTGIIDVDPTYGAYRFYDGSTFRGGLGVGNWAGVGASSDIVQYLNSVNYYISNGTTALVKVESGGNVGIGTTSPAYKLDVSGTTRAYADTSNAVSMITASSTLTYMPSRKVLQLAGTYNSGSNGHQLYVNSTASDGEWEWNITKSWGGKISLGVSSDGTDTTRQLVLKSSGNVGIGTTSPANKLDVRSANGAAIIAGRTNNAGTNSEPGYFNVYAPNASGTDMVWSQIRTVVDDATASGEKSSIYFHNRNAGSFSTAMAIRNSGNVGIGTTSPLQKLHVAGGHILIGNNGYDLRGLDTGGTQRTLVRINNSNEAEYGWSGAGAVKFMGGGSYTERMRIHTNGNVGIGLTSPLALLDIAKTTGASLLIRNGDDANGSNNRVQVRFSFNGTDNYSHFITSRHNSGAVEGNALDFYVGDTTSGGTYPTNAIHNLTLNGGNVGIGTTTPSQKLDVSGYARATSGFVGNTTLKLFGDNTSTEFVAVNTDGTVQITAYGAGILTTDASGNVSVDTSAYLTSYTETQTLDDVTTLGATTANAITVGEITGQKAVDGDVNFIFKNTSTGTSSASNVWIQAEAYSTIRFAKVSTGSQRGKITYDFANEAMSFRTNGVDNRLYINSSGNVGIGTTAPGNKLHIKDGASGFAGTFDSRYKSIVEASGEAYYATYVPDNSFTGIRFNNTSGLKGYIDYYHGTQGDALVYSATNHHRFSIGGLEKMRLSSAGNLGIGTSNPSYTLHVSGTGYVSDDLLVGVGNAASWHRVSIHTGGFIAQSGNKGVGVYSDANANSEELFAYDYTASSYIPLKIRTSTLNILNQTGSTVLYHNGTNVGISTTNIVQPLTVQAASNANTIGLLGRSNDNNSRIDFLNNAGNSRILTVLAYDSANQIYGDTNIPLTISTNAAERMRITGGGNVGINTSNPGERLDVVGNIRSYSAANNYGQIQNGSFLAVGNHGGTFMLDLDNNGTADLVNIKKSGTSRFYIENGGNVGIGTNNPDQLLHTVGGAVKIESDGAAAAGAILELKHANNNTTDVCATINMTNGVGGYAAIEGGTTGANNTGYIAFKTDNAGTQGEAMRIIGNRNVGIGTTSPFGKLNITRSGINEGTISFDDQANNAHLVLAGGDALVRMQLGTYNNGSFGAWIQASYDNGGTNYGTEPLILNPQGGNVGIGTTSPGFKLQVNHGTGAEYVSSFRNTNDNLQIKIGTTTGNLLNIQGATINTNTAYNIALQADGGNVGIGTASPSSKLHIHTATGRSFQVDQSTANVTILKNDYELELRSGGGYDLKLNALGSSTFGSVTLRTNGSEVMRASSNGNVGIGTTAPNNKLDVRRANSGIVAEFHSTAGTPDEYVDVKLISGNGNSGTYGTILRHQRVGTDGADFAILTNPTLTGTPVERFRITRDGDVGIGTASPFSKLEVLQSASGTPLSLRSQGGNSGNVGIRFSIADNTVTSNAYNKAAIYLAGAGATNALGDMVFAVNNSASSANVSLADERMRITRGGNVGIGTTDPTEPLTVVGKILSRYGSSTNHAVIEHRDTSDNVIFSFRRSDGAGGNGNDLVIRSYEDIHLAPNNSDNSKLVVKADGDVGIGTTGPTQKLDVAGNIVIPQGNFLSFRRSGVDNPILWQGNGTFGSADQLYLRQPNNNNLHLQTNGGNTRLLITGSGNVGIGTTSPGHKLHVYVADSNGFALDGLQEYTTMRFQYNGVSKSEFVRQNSNKHLYINNFESGGMMSLINNGNTSVRIDSSNNVGIGHDSPATNLHVVGTAETRLRVGSSNASSNVVLELRDENTPTGQGTVITYNNSTGETYFNNALSTATTDFHFQSGEYGTANDFFTLSNSGGNAILHLKTTSGDSFITYENSTNEMELSSDGDLRLTTPTDQDVFFISSGGNIDMTQAGGTVDMGGALTVDGNGVFNSKVGIGQTDLTADVGLYVKKAAGTVIKSETTATNGNPDVLIVDKDNNSARASLQVQGNGGAIESLFVASNGSVGMGTTNPSYKLTVSSGTDDIGILTASSDSGAYVGFLDNATSTIPKVGAVGNKLILDASQYVGVRRTDPSYALDVSGTIRATGDVIAYSDARVKENVETIPNALDKVKAMRGVGYNKIGEEKRSVGVIAQELLEVLPEAVHQDENGMYSVAYGNIVGVLVEAMKEQQKQIDELKAIINGSAK